MIYRSDVGVLRVLESGFAVFWFGKDRVHDALRYDSTQAAWSLHQHAIAGV